MKTHSLCYFCNEELTRIYGKGTAHEWQRLFYKVIDEKKSKFYVKAYCGAENYKELEEAGAVLTHEDLEFLHTMHIKVIGVECDDGNFSLCFQRELHGMYTKRTGF